MVAVVLFTLVWLVEGRLRLDYRPVHDPISALALGPRGWVQVANFVATGVLFVAFAVGVGLATGGVALPALLGLVGVGLVGAGLWSMDPMRGYPPGTPPGDPDELSTQHRLHDAASGLVFVAVPAAAVVSGLGSTGAWRWTSWGFAVAGLAMLVAFSVVWARQAPGAGLVQRVMVLVNWTWVGLLGLRLLARTA